MGAPTEIALQLAREIVAEYAGENDADLRCWARGQILGAWRLAMRLDYDAAGPALDEFISITGRLEMPTPAPEDTP